MTATALRRIGTRVQDSRHRDILPTLIHTALMDVPSSILRGTTRRIPLRFLADQMALKEDFSPMTVFKAGVEAEYSFSGTTSIRRTSATTSSRTILRQS